MNDNNARPKHPIGVIAQRTGLSPDLIRVWERRYEVVEPSRDEGGRRLYSDQDLERFQLLAQATSEGRSIGQVAALSHEELAELVRDDGAARWNASRGTSGGGSAEAYVEDAMERTRALDVAGLEGVLRRAAAFLGAPTFLESMVVPFFRQIGDGWHRGRVSIAEEHLASGVVRPFLAQLRSALPHVPGAPVLVVTTVCGERHEIGALLIAAAAAVEGWEVVYLGTDLPAEEIARAADRGKARLVAISVVFGDGPEVTAAEIGELRRQLPPDVAILVGGGGAAALPGVQEEPEVRVMDSIQELREHLQRAFPRGGRLPPRSG